MKTERKIAGMALSVWMALSLAACSGENPDSLVRTDDGVTLEEGEVALEKSTGGNPIVGNSLSMPEITYGGDPSILVDGDTVYLYVGHDESTDEEVEKKIYNMKEYLCFSTKDLKTWKSEGTVFKVSTDSVKWAQNSSSSWASQVAKHRDEKSGKDKYYLYFCSWDKTSSGKQSIGVAVSDGPVGPFEDIGEPLVRGTLTEPQSSNWDDIDPTIWIETDESGEEHRYLGWGNSRNYICELNEDMISVKDLNGDGKITYGTSPEKGDVLLREVSNYTEAPWFFRRQDENGKYYGSYYLFYASGWHEKMAYSTTDNLLTGEYTFGNTLMPPTATSNTNHMAVFDFKGKTYFVYHNGSLPGGNGYRRSACITELHFKEDGSIESIPETASGLNGTVAVIETDDDETLSHMNFVNASGDGPYPYSKIKVGINLSSKEEDAGWVVTAGKADETKDSYVSIQSENKPGLYLTANEDDTVTLAQDADASDETARKQTFRTVEGLGDADGISFESVSEPGMYLAVKEGTLCLTSGEDKKQATFFVNRKS